MPHRRTRSPRGVSFSSKNLALVPSGVVFPRSKASAATSYVSSAGPVAYSAAAPIYYVPGSAGGVAPTATLLGKPVPPVASKPVAKFDDASDKMLERVNADIKRRSKEALDANQAKKMLERIEREENARAEELKKRETELRAKAAEEAAAIGRKLSPKRPEGAVRADGAAAALGLAAAASGLADAARRADVEARAAQGGKPFAARSTRTQPPPLSPRPQKKPLAAQSPLTQPFDDLIAPLSQPNPEDAELFRRLEQGQPLFPPSQNVTGAVAGPINLREFEANPELLAAAFSPAPAEIGGNPLAGIAFGGGKRKSPKRRSARRSPAAKRKSPAKRRSPRRSPAKRRSPAAKRRSPRKSPAKRRSPRRSARRSPRRN